MKKNAILIVDDDPNIRQGLVKAVINEFDSCLDITASANGLDASKILLKNKTDILITDLKMPFMDGIELLHFINKNLLYCESIVLSGYDDYSFVREALKTGAKDYLLKPIDFDLLGSTINGLLESLKLSKRSKESSADTAVSFIGPPTHQVNKKLREFFDLSHQKIPDDLINISINSLLSQAIQAVGSYDYRRAAEILYSVFYIFNKEQPSVFEVKKLLTQMIYDLIAENPRFIAPISTSKFTAHDVFNQIESALSLSSLQKQLLESLNYYIKQIIESLQSKDDTVIEQAKTYIEYNYSNDISLENIAAHVFLHPNYFSALFRAKTGATYRQYIRDFRIEKAKYLILQSDMKIYEIALSVGYNDPAHFNRAFKEVTGMSPSHFKEKYIER